MQRSRAAPELPEVVVTGEPAIVAADLEATGAQMAKDTAEYPDVPTVLSPRIATICYMNPVSCFGRRRMGATKYDNLDKRRY
ncbi:hypothetical protein RvY_03619 [Ramazzottius varieornatus]|uniref:Uncharacterized protein n=1 Tax=Ramazzottius varieornatus TaxID=947166 RepID=A0A1D1US30_RAMVA|nr:hypothetical protein RvY_03619 [Ramazzottius varieornatus]